MAEGYVDLSGVYAAISSLKNDLNQQIQAVGRMLSKRVDDVQSDVQEADKKIVKVHDDLLDMDKRMAMAAALQRAVTEIIRVRQELDQNFGTQKLVREYMLGILDASDLSLITKSTISHCTEELMLSAPKYWLAPALVALAAWISDNRPLAERAIKEAYKRDGEKTSLLFAMISRRVSAGRKREMDSDTTFRWLSCYFSFQDPNRMRSSIVSFVDAYANGIFGEDKNHICSEYIHHWMDVLLQSNPDFANEQKNYWKNYFDKHKRIQHSSEDDALKALAAPEQYRSMNEYLTRIDASENPQGIKAEIKGIMSRQADRDALIQEIDNQLKKLVNNYEEDEAPLRDEEQYLEFVKAYKGDEEQARLEMDAIYAKRKDDPVNFAERLSTAITNPNEPISAKKTGIALLTPYISAAFNEFITAPKADYPQAINLTVHESGKITGGQRFDWEGETKDSSNREELVTSLEKTYDEHRDACVNLVTDDAANKHLKQGKVCLYFSVFIVPLFVGIHLRKLGHQELQSNANMRKSLTNYYNSQKATNVNLLNQALDARAASNKTVEDFAAEENAESIAF